MLGPHADATTAMQSNYHGDRPDPPDEGSIVSPAAAMRGFANVTYKQGCGIDSGGPIGIADAAAAAAYATRLNLCTAASHALTRWMALQVRPRHGARPRAGYDAGARGA